MSDLDVITPGIPSRDGCPILTRVKTFIAQEGVPATLQQIFRDRRGNPVNLQTSFSESGESESLSDDSVALKVREFMGVGDCYAQVIHQSSGAIISAADGVVQAPLPEYVYNQSGLYVLSWGFYSGSTLKYVNEGALSVERSLFGNGAFEQPRPIGEGPPTLNTIRMALMDSSAAENQLLDSVEFDDDQILQAVGRPIQYFNETNPPLSVRYSTRDFPWVHHWMEGIRAELFMVAAINYRRNQLAVNAGGLTIDDKNKERQYLQAALLHKQNWKDFVLKKRAELNMAGCVDIFGSVYGGQEFV